MNTIINISLDEAIQIGNKLGINWNQIDAEQFRRGIQVELEHGQVNRYTDVTHDDLLLTGKIALAHLNELGDYYSRLEVIEDPKFTAATLSNKNNDTLKGAILGGALVLLTKYLLRKKH